MNIEKWRTKNYILICTQNVFEENVKKLAAR